MNIEVEVNQKSYKLEIEDDEPLLWALRDGCQIKSPKYGCGASRCGACTVLVNGLPVRSCVIPARDVNGKSITTVEGLGGEGDLHPVQRAWQELQVPQCGYCQAGQMMGAVALLKKVPEPKLDDIEFAMSSHLCRCGTYPRIVRAIQRAVVLMKEEG